MALYLDLPVYKVCNELYLEFVLARRTLPRTERYTVGQELDRARVNSMLGVLSHYDCWHIRKVLAWEGRLREFGEVTDDCLRFYPDVLKIMVGSRVPRDRNGRAVAPRPPRPARGAVPTGVTI